MKSSRRRGNSRNKGSWYEGTLDRSRAALHIRDSMRPQLRGTNGRGNRLLRVTYQTLTSTKLDWTRRRKAADFLIFSMKVRQLEGALSC